MSIRVRAVVAAAAATLVAVAVLGTGVDVLVARHLRHELDSTLRTRAVEVAQLSAATPSLLTAPGSLDSPIGATQSLVEVVDAHGRLVARSLSLGGRVLPVALARRAISGGRAVFANASLGGARYRVYTAPLASRGGAAAGGAVIVAASTDDVAGTIRSLRILTLLSALAAAVVGAAGVAFLMRGALRPLTRLDRAAAEIGRTGDPSRRVPEPPRDDEVGRLAVTLNAMLSSLERVREAERRFLDDAAHELRTPLTALRGNVAHLARHGASPELVADLELDAERLARLADDLLVLSREEAGTAPTEEVRLDELAHATGADVVHAEPVSVRGERAALERALANLVENARRHGAGRVTVSVRAGRDGATLAVEDEGPGVAAADRERVFGRFWRGGPGSGSGLGLAIVRAIAERHGGRATVDGSRFELELPGFRKASESGEHPVGGTGQKGST